MTTFEGERRVEQGRAQGQPMTNTLHVVCPRCGRPFGVDLDRMALVYTPSVRVPRARTVQAIHVPLNVMHTCTVAERQGFPASQIPTEGV